MTWWEKVKAWSLAHWRWLVFTIAAIVALVLGSTKAREWKRHAHLAKKNYKKEKAAIENSHNQHLRGVMDAVAERDEAHEQNVLSFKEKSKQLRREKIRRMLEDSKDDPAAINRYLKEHGIDEE